MSDIILSLAYYGPIPFMHTGEQHSPGVSSVCYFAIAFAIAISDILSNIHHPAIFFLCQ
jgi:hypothetical protein